ncbi:hypothetical protein BDW72DRAFT_197145 [Aspergillus terricola var. indicus]
MRFVINTRNLFIAMAVFAVMVSGHHVRCAGKAVAAPIKDLKDAITYLRAMADGKLWHSGDIPAPPKVHTLTPNSCEQIACIQNAEVRWCNDDTIKSRSMEVEHIAEGASVLLNECKDTYKGKEVAGGLLTHPDKWSVVVQQPARCEFHVWEG